MGLLKNGSKGEDVTALQQKLTTLGYSLDADGIFGGGTEKAVLNLQDLFGYTVDGIVGEGTMRLIDKQISVGWNAGLPDAVERGLRAQGKNDEADALKAAREAGADAAKHKG